MATQRTVPVRAYGVAPHPKVATPPRPPVVRSRSRSAWTFFAFFLFALALIGGEVAARYYPDLALSFRGKVGDLIGRLPETVRPEDLLWGAVGVGSVLILLLAWQAGRWRRPLFLPLALFLCVVSSAVGLYRGGRDLSLQRDAAKLPTLESDLGALKKKLDVATGALQERDETLTRLRGVESDLGAMQKKLDVATGSLQERDGTLSRLRAEIEALQKQLAEQPPDSKD